jgi:hypothetical protein
LEREGQASPEEGLGVVVDVLVAEEEPQDDMQSMLFLHSSLSSTFDFSTTR